MQKKAILLGILLSLPGYALSSSSVVICSIFRDEEPFLLEWIDYHRTLGVEKFFLFSDCGSKATRSKLAEPLLRDHIASGLVELRFRDELFSCNEEKFLKGKRDHLGFQLGAYKKICEEVRGKADWVALIDCDEYIRPMNHRTIPEMLQANYADAGGVFLNWRCFGTSGIALEPGASVLNALTRRTLDSDPENCQGKCLVRPEAFAKISYVHYAQLAPGFVYRDGDGEIMSWNKTHLLHPIFRNKNAVIHHYVFRDEKHFNTFKLPRLKSRLDDVRISEWRERFESVSDHSMETFLRSCHPALFDRICSNFYLPSFDRARAESQSSGAECRTEESHLRDSSAI